MANTYSSISELVKNSRASEAFKEATQQHFSERRVVRKLVALRVAQDKSQADIARELGCSQSRISKLENGTDDDLRLGDFRNYLTALGYSVTLVVSDRQLTIVDRVKYHVHTIRQLLAQLADYAQKDVQIAKGVVSVFNSAFFNLLKIMQDSASKLPKRPDGSDYLQLEVEAEMDTSEGDCASPGEMAACSG